MSDQEDEQEKPFAIERAKTGRAKCKKCKCPIDKDAIRIAKLMSNPFGDGKMKAWHHVSCIFDVFAKQRATTKRIDDPSEDISGWDEITDDDKKIIIDKIQEFEDNAPFKNATKKKSPQKKANAQSPTKAAGPPAKLAKLSKKDSDQSTSKANSKDSGQSTSKNTKDSAKTVKKVAASKDDSFREFRRLCGEISNASAYTDKTAIVKKMLTDGCDGDGFKGDLKLWCKFLLPGAVKRIYNLQSKQLVKLFARLFRQSEDEMLEDLEQGDVAETIRAFFEKSDAVKASSNSALTLQEVDQFLEELTQFTTVDEQTQHFRSILNRCTYNDLKMIIRLIKRDLRINAGPKHILEAVHPDAYKAYQVSNDLDAVLVSQRRGGVKVSLSLMTPVLPMLAEACKSVEMAMKKCPNGMLAEVKYDGERVQVHKKGSEFRYFSRSLKPVLAHKIKLFKDFIPEAFPDGDDLILDSEILMIDTNTSQPLPFGSLGKHKKEEFKNANVCLFVFDCIYYNGEDLMSKSMKERREILEDRMTVIPNRIMLSEVEEVHNSKGLARMIAKVLKLGLEGLVLKDMNSLYEPGKRHWLKVKKDYLFDGAMADSADLVVLGAWYGTGNKGGMMSIWLMGCYDEDEDQWVTVTKVHGGHDDATLARLQNEMDMIKIGRDYNSVPDWLNVNRPMVPDFVARDPKRQPVWEITGAEFTNQGVHTADSISIRFPRVTKIRDDKNWQTATSLRELRELFKKSSASVDFSLLLGPESLEEVEKSIEEEKKASHRTIADDDSKPGTSRISTSPSGSPRKRINDKKINNVSSDEETDIRPNFQKKKKGSKRKSDEGSSSEESDSFANSSASSTPRKKRAQTNGIFSGVRVSISPNFDSSKLRNVQTTLKAHGAEILRKNKVSEVTHVIHDSSEIPSSALHDYSGISKKARHVNYSWVGDSVKASRMLDVLGHAVKLVPSYCECPCDHRSID